MRSRKSYGLTDPNGSVWFEAFAYKHRAIDFAVQRCISADEYTRLSNDSARWALAYKRGYRVVRVTVTICSSDIKNPKS